MAIKLAWNKDLFREKIIEYIEGKNETSRDVATKIVSAMVDEAQKGRVEVVQTHGLPESGNE